jgi:CHAT domain-containing protein
LEHTTTREETTALLVAQASASDLPLLSNVDIEIRRVAEALPSTTITHILGTDSSAQPANVESVLEALPGISMLHLSCHAQQDYSHPLSSAFLLADGKLTVSDLMKLKMPDHTYFAFLSSCQSAAGDPTLPDEAIHLAGTMLYAGFKSVVATLWFVGARVRSP